MTRDGNGEHGRVGACKDCYDACQIVCMYACRSE